MENKISIKENSPHAILCEGIDAYYFLIWFLDNKVKSNSIFEQFCVYNYGGIDDLDNYLNSFVKMPGFKGIIQSITVIRDAENDAKAACRSINNSLTRIGFRASSEPYKKLTTTQGIYVNKSTGFLLFPICSEDVANGTLEDLCLAILKDKICLQNLPDVKNFVSNFHHLTRIHKNILHTCFSVTDTFVSLKIGEAATAGAFDWSSPPVCAMENFLLEMAK